MTFSIKYKLMLTMVATVVVVVGIMLLLTKWSFDRGFMHYVNSVERDMYSNLVNMLADEYRSTGSWEALRSNPRLWWELNLESLSRADVRRLNHFQISGMRSRPPPTSGTSPGPPPGPPQGEWHEHEHRLFIMHPRTVLFDAHKKPVVGRFYPGETLNYMPIKVNDQTVGYLGVRPRNEIFKARDLRFSRRLTRAFIYIAMALAIAFALVALPVSRQLVRPIQKLSGAMRRLASGRYDTRIAVVGHDELSQLARDFNSLSNTLEHNENSRRQWIADISHELRTPLAVLQGEIEAMQDGIRDCTPERLKQIHVQTLNLSRLVNDLYELSLSDLGALSYRKESIDVRGIVDSCILGLRDAFEEKHIGLDVPSGNGRLMVFGDPDRIKQMFFNVLHNSLRHTGAGGKVQVEISKSDNHIVVDVQDSAPGVGPEHLSHLFERLYRVDNSRSRATGGAGLGLAISRNIVEAHEGTISARASTLGGLWVHIELPAET